MLEFKAKVLAAVRRIPPGRVASYGQVAALAGTPRAARAVGNIMRECHRPDVPCHRVIAANGRLGGYGGNELLKRELLKAEGIVLTGNRIRNLATVTWTGSSDRTGRRGGVERAGRARPTRGVRPPRRG